MSLADIDTRALLDGVWRAADLSYLLHDGQVRAMRAFDASKRRVFVESMSRRWGKSWKNGAVGVRGALRKPDAIVLYATPTQKMARTIVEPHLRQILADAPLSMRPSYSRQEGVWRFPNGSEIRLAGCDNGNAERLRGAACDLFIVDEAGFVDDLEYVVQDILLPQTLTTNGRGLLSSTPSRSPEHAFVSRYMLDAEADGSLYHATIHDAPHISAETIAEYCAECGGEESTTWQREYLARAIVDETRAIVPEFFRHRSDVVVDIEAPRYCYRYTVADFGYNDLTVVGFFEHHFTEDVLYQRDELVFRNQGSHVIAPAVAEREAALWGRAPDARFGDPNASKSHGEESEITLGDLAELHGQVWAPVRRDKLTAGVNALRVAIAGGRRAWHPRCTTTIAHLAGGVWNAHRTSFERSGEHGHFDAVAMSVYSEREIDRSRNPYPAHEMHGRPDAFIRHDRLREANHGAVEAWMGGGRRR
ncbi:MAG: hypothetical protein MUF00_01680 [Gemmatimonadaceae bacterium]|jgi:hypothetical protein|nr:hypothetical protein [Gemmatimonadaceae bacterium]